MILWSMCADWNNNIMPPNQNKSRESGHALSKHTQTARIAKNNPGYHSAMYASDARFTQTDNNARDLFYSYSVLLVQKAHQSIFQ